MSATGCGGLSGLHSLTVEFERGDERRAEYVEAMLERLSKDLTQRYGRGFARPNLIRFRQFYLAFPAASIRSILAHESPATSLIRSTLSNEFALLKHPPAAIVLLPVEFCPTTPGIAITPESTKALREQAEKERQARIVTFPAKAAS